MGEGEEEERNAEKRVVAAVHAISVTGPSKAVQAEKGHSATLPCTFASSFTKEKTDFVSWREIRPGSQRQEEFARKTFDGTENLTPSYKGRLSFSTNLENGDAGITLDQVTMDDNGTYECLVQMANDFPSQSVQIELLVLVSPSKPVCKIDGTPEYGRNINLTCHSVEGSPEPQYTWQSYDPQNQSRPLQGTTTGGGVLMLNNISADTSGYFICLSKNTVGEDKCNITVAVRPPSMNFALYAGIIGGVLAAIIIISVLIYCCCCRESKNKDYEATETENKFQPQHESVQIRGPSREEIQDEEEERPHM
ncbi:cell surface A33 antigen isoform 2-T2 [Liasis olivaceus]